jgi:hypothetical protein
VGTEKNNRTVAQIAEAVLGAVPGAQLLITGETGPDPRSYRVDFSRLRNAVPGFTARWSIPVGAADLVEAYRVYGLTQHEFDRRFTRLARLTDRAAAGELGEDLRPIGSLAGSERA